MGWSLGYDRRWKRDIGYGVPAWCDYPGCMEKIDRGLAHVCGGEPYGGENGCGLYFCEEHHGFFCERCLRNQQPFTPKPEHPEWLKFKATDPSWAEWRKEHANA